MAAKKTSTASLKAKATPKAKAATAKTKATPKAKAATAKTKVASQGAKAATPKTGVPSSALSLSTVRRPLEAPAKLKSHERAQLELLLKQEGFGSVREAQNDEEVSFELVDVTGGSKVLYQLWLWPFGSGALFEAGTTDVVAEIIQHSLEVKNGDAQLPQALVAAIEADAKRVGLLEGAPPKPGMAEPAKTAKASARGGVDAAIADGQRLVDEAKKNPHNLRDELEEVFKPWLDQLRPTRRGHLEPYPRQVPAELTADQRKILLQLLAWDRYSTDYEYRGLPPSKDWLRRFLGESPPGPSDAIITLDGRKVPAWWAICAVASGHANSAAVLAALGRLDAATQLEIVREVATGNAYDLHVAAEDSFRDASIEASRGKVRYRTALVGLVADLAASLGDAGIKLAAALLVDLPVCENRSKHGTSIAARILIALTALARAKAPLDAHANSLRALSQWISMDRFYAKPAVNEVLKALPAPTRAEFASLLAKR